MSGSASSFEASLSSKLYEDGPDTTELGTLVMKYKEKFNKIKVNLKGYGKTLLPMYKKKLNSSLRNHVHNLDNIYEKYNRLPLTIRGIMLYVHMAPIIASSEILFYRWPVQDVIDGAIGGFGLWVGGALFMDLTAKLINYVDPHHFD